MISIDNIGNYSPDEKARIGRELADIVNRAKIRHEAGKAKYSSDWFFGDNPEKRARNHQYFGTLTSGLLGALLGGGAMLGGSAIFNPSAAKGIEGWKTFGLGALLGGGAAGLAHHGGFISGLVGGDPDKYADAISDPKNVWKNYLIPGYAGYQSGAGVRASIKNDNK